MKLDGNQRRILMTVALFVAIAGTFIVASIVSSRVFEHSGSPAGGQSLAVSARQRAHASDANAFRVAAIEGPVETFHRGQWYVVQAGDSLSLEDVVRTPRGSRALLRRGGSEIEVKENVDIRLDRLAASTASFDVLRGGNVIANVETGGEALEITARRTRTANRGTARWIVSLGPLGQVSVAASKGEVRFSSHGKEVAIAAGMESVAVEAGAPSEPEKIPAEIFMSVIWPELQRQEPQAPIRGKVRPSSRVSVNGVEAPVDHDGAFSSSATLGAGANRVEVSVEDIMGRKKTAARTIEFEAPKPSLRSTSGALWKK
jgi:hypothetical protein